MTTKSVMHDTVKVGDQIICDGAYATVVEIKTCPPYQHPTSPIHNDWIAVAFVTTRGIRWIGYRDDTTD